MFALTICACLFSLTLFTAKAGSVSGISYLNASVGETYDKVGIAYHCSEDESYVLYGTSISGNSIVNPTKVESTSILGNMMLLKKIKLKVMVLMKDMYVKLIYRV